MKKAFVLLLFVVIVCAGVFAGSPYYTVYQLKKAYDNQDGMAIAEAIDYPKLTNDIKGQLNHRFQTTVQQYPMVAKMGGTALMDSGNQFINNAVDGTIDKENIANIIRTQGQVNQKTKELAAVWAIASNKINLSMLVADLIAQRGNLQAVIKNQINVMINQQEKEQAKQATNSDEAVELTYCAIDCFQVSGEIMGYPITVELQRADLIDWKIVGIDLP